MRLLVTGGRTGYVGRYVVRAAEQHDVVAVGSADGDVRDRGAVDALLVELAANDVRGVLHVGGAHATSRLELGRLVARRDGLDPRALHAGRRADLPDPGPVDVRLDSTLASTVLTTRLRGAREFLTSG